MELQCCEKSIGSQKRGERPSLVIKNKGKEGKIEMHLNMKLAKYQVECSLSYLDARPAVEGAGVARMAGVDAAGPTMAVDPEGPFNHGAVVSKGARKSTVNAMHQGANAATPVR